MALTLEYPENWLEIAATVKQAAGYRCNRCGLKCLPPHNSYRHLDLSLRRKLSAQVHHLDGNPAQNDKSNLVCLCSGCHLPMHRHRPQPTPGQLSLKLKLPKVRKARKQKQNWQLTLADLIDRLPRLSVELHRQLELDLSSSRLRLMEQWVDRLCLKYLWDNVVPQLKSMVNIKLTVAARNA